MERYEQASFLVHLIDDSLEHMLDLSLVENILFSWTTKMLGKKYVQTFTAEWITCKPL